MRDRTSVDRALGVLQNSLKTLFPHPQLPQSPYPAAHITPSELSDDRRRHVIGLMRVNHTGEVCAQALYQSQALTARTPELTQALHQASLEEHDHLLWCEQRLSELGGRTSLLNPFFYAGSFALGCLAGWAGDEWNLGFLAHTEEQVAAHLQRHLDDIQAEDPISFALLKRMQEDELKHREQALMSGAKHFPQWLQQGMQWTSRLMTYSAYRV